MKRKLRTLLLPLLLLLPALSTVQAEEPVVRAVLFWAETCPHCHVVLDETLPPLQARYGSQLEVLTVELTDQAGYELWILAIEALQIPNDRLAVPMLLIGDQVLVGSYEIPEQLPKLIDRHLAAGGLDYPPIPGLEAWVGTIPEADPPPTPEPSATTPPSSPQPVATPTPGMPEPDPEAIVHFWLFHSSHCPPCLTLKQEILPPILAKYAAGQVVVHEWDLEKGDAPLMYALEAKHGLEYGDIPEIFIGDHALLGNAEIEARLEGLIDFYLAQGGVALPQADLPAPTPTPAETPAQAAPPIHLAYFYQAGCRECDRVSLDLNYLQGRYPQLVVREFDVQADAALCEWLGSRAGVPEAKRLVAPAVFVGEEALVDQELTMRALEALVSRHETSGAKAAWQGWEAAQEEAAGSIVARFRSFGALTVLVAGLVDGLNPCAFATIVFFISYLTFVGRRRREVLAVGAAFALGVFVMYLGVGLGFLRFLAALPFLSAISRWVYGLTAVLCLVLAAGSLYDWWQARRGKPEEMRLKLPLRLRRWINRVIREGAGLRAFVPVAFVTGMAISIIELACTGQVYLPTILFVLSVPELQARARLYLVLYNLMFILPLVVVFLLAYFGTTSEQLAQFVNRRLATVKLATAGLFLLLAGWLLVTVV
jgi:cytochrome c biogenesis protein CcdA/thiol-disulfide isomerase/thioredoxin